MERSKVVKRSESASLSLRIAELASWVQGLYPVGGAPVLVGGAAVELHAGPALTTGDLDFVGSVPETVSKALTASGFVHHGREWVNEEKMAILEFRPGGLTAGEGSVVLKFGAGSARSVGTHSVLCLGREELLVNRLVSWATWASPIDGMNAYFLFTRPKVPPDTARTEALARARGADEALVSLRSLMARKHSPQEMEGWAVRGASSAEPKGRPGIPPPPRRRRPRAFLKWAALRRWNLLPHWEEFTAGYILREARERAGLTQCDLAARLGVSQQAVAQAERWRANPTAHFLRAWAQACGEELLIEFSGHHGNRGS